MQQPQPRPPAFPRMADYALVDDDPVVNARKLRHGVKGRLNSLCLLAGGLLREETMGRCELRDDVRQVLQDVCDEIPELSKLIDQVRELPPQPQTPPQVDADK